MTINISIKEILKPHWHNMYSTKIVLLQLKAKSLLWLKISNIGLDTFNWFNLSLSWGSLEQT